MQVVRCRLWRGEGGPGFFDDFPGRSGVSALGEFVCGEEFGVAVVAVAGAEEVEQAFFGDGDGFWSCTLFVVRCS